VDTFAPRAAGVWPTKAAAQLESKAFQKAFMKRHGIQRQSTETFTDASAAHAYVDERCAIVVKADGLCGTARVCGSHD
jgi:phosphoribosylamine--glycine ligase